MVFGAQLVFGQQLKGEPIFDLSAPGPLLRSGLLPLPSRDPSAELLRRGVVVAAEHPVWEDCRFVQFNRQKYPMPQQISPPRQRMIDAKRNDAEKTLHDVTASMRREHRHRRIRQNMPGMRAGNSVSAEPAAAQSYFIVQKAPSLLR